MSVSEVSSHSLDSLNEFVDKIGYAAGEAIAAARSRATDGVLPGKKLNRL